MVSEKIFEKEHEHTHYCSYFPDHFLKLDLRHYCKAHDEHYANKTVSRKEADIQLRENVKAIGGVRAWITSWIMYIGVRIGGRWIWKS